MWNYQNRKKDVLFGEGITVRKHSLFSREQRMRYIVKMHNFIWQQGKGGMKQKTAGSFLNHIIFTLLVSPKFIIFFNFKQFTFFFNLEKNC